MGEHYRPISRGEVKYISIRGAEAIDRLVELLNEHSWALIQSYSRIEELEGEVEELKAEAEELNNQLRESLQR